MRRWSIAGLLILFALTGCQTGPQSVRYPTASMPGFSRPVDITASIYKPQGEGPFQAVIILHGSGGAREHHHNWARTLTSWGYVAAVVDSYRPRGHEHGIMQRTDVVTPNDRVSDIIGTIEHLREQPYIDPKAFGVIGFSHGGWTAMKAVQDRVYLKDYGVRGIVAYYPYCHPTQDVNIDVPLLILIGDDDTATPTERCRQLQGNLRGRAATLTEMVFYPGTYHSFDENFSIRPVMQWSSGGGVKPHMMGHNPSAAADAEQRTRAFFRQHLKGN